MPVDLRAVSDWAEPGTDWPAGTAPVSIGADVRYEGGVAISERFRFTVAVPWHAVSVASQSRAVACSRINDILALYLKVVVFS